MFNFKNIFWVSFWCLLFGIAFYLRKPIYYSFCSKITKKHKLTKKQKTINVPEIIVQNFNIKEISQDKKDLWVLTSKEGKIFKKLNQIECIDTVCFLREDDQEIALLKAEKSILDQNSKSLFLYGPVSGNFRELKLYGQNLKYNISDHTIRTQNQLTYWYLNFKLDAQETVLNLKENKIEMKNGVKTEILNNPTGNHS